MERPARRRPLHPLAARRHPGRRRHGLQRTRPRRRTSRSCSTRQPSRCDRRCAAACELLGIDPLYVANEGKFVAVVAADEADAALGRAARPPARRRRHADRRDPRGAARASSCSSPRSAAPGSSTCWSATRSPASADEETAKCESRRTEIRRWGPDPWVELRVLARRCHGVSALEADHDRPMSTASAVAPAIPRSLCVCKGKRRAQLGGEPGENVICGRNGLRSLTAARHGRRYLKRRSGHPHSRYREPG